MKIKTNNFISNKDLGTHKIQWNGFRTFYLYVPIVFIDLFNTTDFKNIYVHVYIENNELIVKPLLPEPENKK